MTHILLHTLIPQHYPILNHSLIQFIPHIPIRISMNVFTHIITHILLHILIRIPIRILTHILMHILTHILCRILIRVPIHTRVLTLSLSFNIILSLKPFFPYPFPYIRSIIIQRHILTQFVMPFLSHIPNPRPCRLDLMLVFLCSLVLRVRFVFLLHSATVSAAPAHDLSGLHHQCACASHVLI